MKALIVDDEEHNRVNLGSLLDQYVPEISMKEVASCAEEAMAKYHSLQPDIIFLDISMPRKNGFELLDDLSGNKAEIVFVTAYDEYAIKAIKRSPAGYVLKPIDISDLKESVDRAVQNIKNKESLKREYETAINDLKNQLTGKMQEQSITLKLSTGMQFVQLKDILFLEADGSYTLFHLASKRIMVSHPLAHYQELLPNDFVRVHRSFLVNKHNIELFSSKRKKVEMVNGRVLPVSVRKIREVSDQIR
jgi:two-component system LytT family response regulator